MAMGIVVDIIRAEIQGVFIAALIFILVYYGLNRDWLKNVYARMIVSLDICLMLLDFPSCLRVWTGLNVTNQFFAWYQAVSIGLTIGVILWRTYMIIRIQVTRYRRDIERSEHGEISGSSIPGAGAERGGSTD